MTQRAPVKTIAMLGSLLMSTCISYLMHRLWLAGKLDGRRDFFACMQRAAQSRSAIATDTEEANASIGVVEVSSDHLKEEKSTYEKEDVAIPLTTTENGKQEST